MTAVARYQYQEVNNFILFPSLIPLIKTKERLSKTNIIISSIFRGVPYWRNWVQWSWWRWACWKITFWTRCSPCMETFIESGRNPGLNAGRRSYRADISSECHWCQQSQAFKPFLLFSWHQNHRCWLNFADHVPNSSSFVASDVPAADSELPSSTTLITSPPRPNNTKGI